MVSARVGRPTQSTGIACSTSGETSAPCTTFLPFRESGLVEYVPIALSDVPQLFTGGQIPLDVAMVQVAPPDPDGTCSLGISVDVTKAAALAARTVIAEVNPAMPRTAGGQQDPG